MLRSLCCNTTAVTKVKHPVREGVAGGACTNGLRLDLPGAPPSSSITRAHTCVWTNHASRWVPCLVSREGGGAGTPLTLIRLEAKQTSTVGDKSRAMSFLGSLTAQHSSLLPLCVIPFCFLLCSNFLLLCRDSPISGQALNFSLPSWLLKHSK